MKYYFDDLNTRIAAHADHYFISHCIHLDDNYLIKRTISADETI